MNTKLLFIQALSPLHAGIGQGVDVIDLPIAREKSTGIPFLPGSTLKGVFRDGCSDPILRKNVFGPETSGDPSEHAGAVTFTDARLLLMPIRSLRGVFVWATSPLLLRRLRRDAYGYNDIPREIPVPGKDECLFDGDGNNLKVMVGIQEKVILEDLPLDPKSGTNAVTSWATWIGKNLFPDSSDDLKDFHERFCVIPDDILGFLLETATEVTARIRIEDHKKTVAEGQLWYEEALPSETVLVCQVGATTIKAASNIIADEKTVFNTVRSIAGGTLQFGGKATVGRGLCRTHPAWEEIR